MNHKLARVAGAAGFFALALVIALSGLTVVAVRRPWPQTEGTIGAPGLQGAVEIYRDQWGVPQIYASSAHDLFFAQGYVHAQDRFWQMDVWRHTGQARLSEMFGQATLETDQFLRTLGWARLAEQELALLNEDARAILEAYAEGVNAYLAAHPDALGLEYSLLGLNNKDYTVEPWTPVNTLTWAKAMAWDLGGNRTAEIENARIVREVGEAMWRDFRTPYPADAPVIVPTPAIGALPLDGLARRMAQVDAILGGGMRGLGSNNWVIGGERTTTGMPILANDPHLSIQMPSIWYEVGLHCAPKGANCPFEVSGFSFAGTPGVIIGHNDRIAWGMTNVGPDVQDLFIEKINPANPDQYEVNGQWVDMQTVSEVIRVAGGEDVPITVRYTRHGPVISDVVESYRELDATTALDLPEQYAIAFRWTALEPSMIFQAIWKLNRAANFDEFREALREFDVPSQNLVYADVDGNIGYQMPGRIPVRAGGNGQFPAPGWTDEYEWTGYIPFEELAYSFNPPQGYLATANNAVVGPEYPYLISLDWDRGYRAQRIVEMIEAQDKISIEYIQAMQGDNKSLIAPVVLPYLFALGPADAANLQAALASLRGWDYQAHMDSQPAAIFHAFWAALVKDLFYDQLSEELWPGGGDDQWLAVSNLLTQPENAWWDDARTADRFETRDDILRLALTDAVADLEARLGGDQSKWAWGALHTSTFRNQTFGQSGIGIIEALFNRGPLPTSGGEAIVNATGWSVEEPYATRSLPSMRMIVDLGDLTNSLAMHTTGQSGHAYHPHYADMIEPWRKIQYHPMLWDRNSVEQAAVERLTLSP